VSAAAPIPIALERTTFWKGVVIARHRKFRSKNHAIRVVARSSPPLCLCDVLDERDLQGSQTGSALRRQTPASINELDGRHHAVREMIRPFRFYEYYRSHAMCGIHSSNGDGPCPNSRSAPRFSSWPQSSGDLFPQRLPIVPSPNLPKRIKRMPSHRNADQGIRRV
jgi:hypothetical protein